MPLTVGKAIVQMLNATPTAAQSCISDKAKTKKVQQSIYKAELERVKARQQTVKAKVMKRKRSSTVEPVWGTLINYTGMKRLNARGLNSSQ